MFKQAFVEALSKCNPHLKNYIYIWCNNDSTGVPMEISSPQYRIAFEQYLRRGTPIDLTLKQARTTTNYIWRTRKDRKVRASHAANDGKIFAWNNPPSTGHPGDEFGCRCTAEPYYGAGQETMSHTLHGLTSAGPRWENNDFVWHFFTGNGRSLSLSQIGHLYEIANYWAYGLSIFQNWNVQIVEEARKRGHGNIRVEFVRSYDFEPIEYSHGNSVVRGIFTGSVQPQGPMLSISGEAVYEFSDRFTDPLDLREFWAWLREQPDRIKRIAQATGANLGLGNPSIGRAFDADHDNVSNLFHAISEMGGTAYPITGRWRSAMVASVFKDPSKSRYRRN